MKHIREIKVTENPGADAEFPFICPLSQQVYNGRNKFIVLWSCGCVFSEKVIKDMKMKNSSLCPVCNEKYEQQDVIVLGLSNEEVEMKRAELIQQQ